MDTIGKLVRQTSNQGTQQSPLGPRLSRTQHLTSDYAFCIGPVHPTGVIRVPVGNLSPTPQYIERAKAAGAHCVNERPVEIGTMSFDYLKPDHSPSSDNPHILEPRDFLFTISKRLQDLARMFP